MLRRVAPLALLLPPALLSCAPHALSGAPASPPSSSSASAPSDGAPLPSVATKTKDMKRLDGFFPLYWDARKGELWLEVSRWNTEFLFVESLATGVGLGRMGLDRGELGDAHVVQFERIGPKVLLKETNLKHRSSSASAAEKAAVGQSFPSSILWGGTVGAEDPGGRALVDATSFFTADAHDVAQKLKVTRQGTYAVEPSRSAVSIESTKDFPENTEVESVLTFVNKDPDPEKKEPGAAISAASTTPSAVTVREHYSLIQLPDAGYSPRAFDPRGGYFDLAYEDYDAATSQPLDARVIWRHRLVKKDPTAALSDPVKPIVYYLDPGIPEPLRAAIQEGASWWNDAFTKAGFRNAFRVETLPPGADPMDVRYNDIEWVHGATRGWSTGFSIVDPRTGEILKGHVLLGSKRTRQDYLIFEGLLAPYPQGKPADPRLMTMVLARLRQLAAHEVGHTLGLRHNFAASASDRASVMDYPAPRVTLGADGALKTDDAYAKGLGAWDLAAIRWGYSQFGSTADEKRGLGELLNATTASGLLYLSDEDAWAPGSANAVASQWDDGRNAIDQLADVMRVRAKALERFGEENLAPGQPLAALENVLVPIYLFHRYQLEAATREIGGWRYAYAVRGGSEARPEAVAADEQRRALKAVLATVAPETLVIPERILKLIPPQPAAYERTQESFASYTSPMFDPVGAAQSAAQMTLGLLLDPQRAARLVAAPGRDARQLGLAEVIDRVWQATWKGPASAPAVAPVRRIVDEVALATVIGLVTNAGAAPEVRAVAYGKLQELRAWATAQEARARSADDRAHVEFALAQIRKVDVAPGEMLKGSEGVAVPPGAPIGGGWGE